MSPAVLSSIYAFIREGRRKEHISRVLLLLAVLAILVLSNQADAQQSRSPALMVGDTEIQAVITAIKDEVYANGYQKAFVDIGPDRIPLYVNPRVENGMIWVIYKLMPFGEVLRGAFSTNNPQVAILAGDPHNNFPPTQGASMKTVYLPDDDVIKMKTTWRKSHFSVDMDPSAQTLAEAKRRQELRRKLGAQ